MPGLLINGKAAEAPEGTTLLEALRGAGVEVPTLCHDGRLKPYGGCRLCMVRVEGQERPVAACTTPVLHGMRVQTHTPELEGHRRTLLRLLAKDCAPDKELRRYLEQYGVEAEAGGCPAACDDSHPYIHVDMSRCVTCYRCIRICGEVQGQFVWEAWNRGDRTEIRPADGGNLLESPCVGCGACVSTCPSGALEDKSVLAHGTAESWTRTTCAYCGVGCELEVGTREGRIVQIRPALDAPVNQGHLCVKGRYAFGYVDAPDRVTTPMIRRDGTWEKASWEEAVAFTADRLRHVLDRYGPGSVGVLGSARATNEENYLAQKFARTVLGTHNVDCCARVCHGPTAAAMSAMLGTGAATNAFDDIERAACFLVCGSNPTENHPVVGARIKQQVLGGASLIVIDPRRIELAGMAAVHLALRPGTNVLLLNALASAIVEEGLADEGFLRERTEGWAGFREFLKAYAPERVAAECGVEASDIRKAARLYASRGPAMIFHGLGMTEHVQGTEGVMALVNLALLTGNLGRPGSGVNPLRGQNNVQGSAHMGCEPSRLAGYAPIASARPLVESVWGARLPEAPGMNLLQMMDAARDGRLKALWVMGYDLLLTNADANATWEALEGLEFVVVQDLFLSETARAVGSVFLPAASAFEKDGTFMNSERRVQRVRKALAPRGEARSDWEGLCAVARAMGQGAFFDYRSAEDIWEEVRKVWKAGAGISYRRIEKGGLQWPCPSEEHPGTALLHAESFPMGKRAAFRELPYTPSAEKTGVGFPFLLTTGRTLYQFNAGTMSLRTENRALRPEDTLDLSPGDAERLGLRDGDRAKVLSRHGEAVLPIRITLAVKPGEAFATFHNAEVFLNRVTGPGRDAQVQTPEYKVTAVRIERA